MIYTIKGCEFVVEKGLVRLQVWRDYSHQIIKISRHWIALHHLRPIEYLLGKMVEIFFHLMV